MRKPADEIPPAFLWFQDRFPEVAAAHERLGEAVRRAGPLSAREVALVKVAIAIGARMEGATHAHVRKALSADVEPAALDQVALLACPTVGFPQTMMALGWVRDVVVRAEPRPRANGERQAGKPAARQAGKPAAPRRR